MIRNNLRQLAAERAARGGTFASARRIVEGSGASRTTVRGLLAHRLRRLPLDDLDRLCAWLGCQPGDLLYVEEEHGTSTDEFRPGDRGNHPGDDRVELGSG